MEKGFLKVKYNGKDTITFVHADKEDIELKGQFEFAHPKSETFKLVILAQAEKILASGKLSKRYLQLVSEIDIEENTTVKYKTKNKRSSMPKEVKTAIRDKDIEEANNLLQKIQKE